MTPDLHLAGEVLRLRHGQMILNEHLRSGAFRVPVHLALGHEAVALAVSGAMQAGDDLLLPHRNLHYNLARCPSLRAVVDEFLLLETGLAGGRYGSMNLFQPATGVLYASSILGNNLCVVTGVALAARVTGSGAVPFVVTGDGAMEEGSFYEMLVMLSGQSLPTVVVVENNEWSLASRIEERRAAIDVGALARGCGAEYAHLSGNDVYAYAQAFVELRAQAAASLRPVVVEVELKTLGDWREPTPEFPDGKFINYHAGLARTVTVDPWPVLAGDDSDPVQVLSAHFPEDVLRPLAQSVLARLQGELA
ncbi:MAG: thiamine pyrophosphate-dependent enzyme [Alphaproteobacteria bacterium]